MGRNEGLSFRLSFTQGEQTVDSTKSDGSRNHSTQHSPFVIFVTFVVGSAG